MHPGNVSMGDDNWRTPQFRQQIRNKLEEQFKQSPAPISRNVSELENTIFTNSKTKDDYIQNAIKVLQCIKDHPAKQKQQQMVQQQQHVQQPPPNQQGPPQQQMSQVMQGGMVNQGMGQLRSATDPMSALQNLASFPAPENQPTMIKTVPVSNSLQDPNSMTGVTVTSTGIGVPMGGGLNGPGVGQIQMAQGIQMQQINTSQGGIQMQAVGPPGSGPPQMQQMAGIGGPQGQITTLTANGPQIVQQRMSVPQNRMMIGQMMVQPGPNPGASHPGGPVGRPQMMTMQMTRMRQVAPNMTIQAQIPPTSDGSFYQTQTVQHRPQQPGPPQQQQHFQQNTMSPQMQQSHMMMSTGPQQINPIHPPQHQSQMNQIHVSMSPASSTFAPSPSQGIMPSPMSVGMIQRGPGSIPSVPSPSPLNTPQMVAQVSPAQRQMTDEQAYQEKLKQLSRFIEPLRARLEREESVSDKKKDLSKIRNLLSIISDSGNRVPMEILLKCESLLEKMDFGNQSSAAESQQATIQPTGPPQKIQDHNIGQPLIDALVNNIKRPFFNHTLHRTFARAVSALTSGSQRIPSPPPKKRALSNPIEIPEVIQGEVVRLDQKFKIQLHPLHQSGSKTIHLICRLDDQDLPCIPPISLKVPDSYPTTPPQCFIDDDEYSASPILSNIKRLFDEHIGKLPNIYSIMTLLNRWEMSVRQACNNQASVAA